MAHRAVEVGVDVVVVGGGIAGLWTAARLRATGYSVVVIESRALGAGQTIASQGIIHGGIKYALTGAASRASRAIAEMPALWRACLAGRGEVDLRTVRVLSESQFLWTTASIGSRLAAVAASRVLRTSVERVMEEDRPAGLRSAPKGVDVYRVDEPVLEPRSVVEAVAAAAGAGVCAEAVGVERAGERWHVRVRLRDADAASHTYEIEFSAGAVVLAAGAGNAELIAAAEQPRGGDGGTRPSPGPHPQGGSVMQRRPLHMVMARGGSLPTIYGHCIGMSDKPRVTITTQRDAAGRPVWYIGGQVAEEGVGRGRGEQIEATRREIAACAPWIDLTGAEWATLRIDRAEGLTEGGKRPDEPVLREIGPRAWALWPTKLAFAPEAARRVVEAVEGARVARNGAGEAEAAGLDRAGVGELPWDREGVEWSV